MVFPGVGVVGPVVVAQVVDDRDLDVGDGGDDLEGVGEVQCLGGFADAAEWVQGLAVG